MQVIESGQLSGVTGNDFTSGVSSPPIDLSGNRVGRIGVYARVYGDVGRTVASGGSVAVVVKASPSKEGVYGCYYIQGGSKQSPQEAFVLKSGTSKTGLFGDGTSFTSFDMVVPFVRIHAIASKSAATKTTGVTWALFAL